MADKKQITPTPAVSGVIPRDASYATLISSLFTAEGNGDDDGVPNGDDDGNSDDNGKPDGDGDRKPSDSEKLYTEAEFQEAFEKRLSRIDRNETTLKAQLSEIQSELAEYKEREETARRKDLEDKEEWKTLLEEREAAWKDKEAAYKDQLSTADTRYQALVTDHQLDDAIKAYPGVNPQYIRVIKRDLLEGVTLDGHHFKIAMHRNGDDSPAEVVVLDDDGKRRLNGKGEFLTPNDAVSQYLDQNPVYILAKQRSGTGMTGSVSDPIPRNQLQAALQAAKEKADGSGASADIQAYRKLYKQVQEAANT
jgi:hypothetical protein